MVFCHDSLSWLRQSNRWQWAPRDSIRPLRALHRWKQKWSGCWGQCLRVRKWEGIDKEGLRGAAGDNERRLRVRGAQEARRSSRLKDRRSQPAECWQIRWERADGHRVVTCDLDHSCLYGIVKFGVDRFKRNHRRGTGDSANRELSSHSVT